jgi:hypothetical protein
MHEFQLRMGYTAKPVRQRVIFHPRLAPFFNSVTYAALRFMKRLRPGNPLVSKAEGMVRFFIEGKRPAEQQKVPEPLRGLSLGEADREHCARLLNGD